MQVSLVKKAIQMSNDRWTIKYICACILMFTYEQYATIHKLLKFTATEVKLEMESAMLKKN